MSYSMPLKDLRVIMASDLASPDIEQIRKAFFPELDDIEALKGIVYCPWFKEGQLPSEIHVGGKNARMPYNIVANNMDSLALGTQANPQGACELRSLKQKWTMWQTASRSCVIRLDSIGDKEPVPSTQDFDESMELLWDLDTFVNQEGNISVNDHPFDLGSMYDHNSILPKCFSLKIGSYYIYFSICRILTRCRF
jgi:hypothetical protein